MREQGRENAAAAGRRAALNQASSRSATSFEKRDDESPWQDDASSPSHLATSQSPQSREIAFPLNSIPPSHKRRTSSLPNASFSGEHQRPLCWQESRRPGRYDAAFPKCHSNCPADGS